MHRCFRADLELRGLHPCLHIPKVLVIKLLLLGLVTGEESVSLFKCGHAEIVHLFIHLIKNQLFFCSLSEHLSSSHHVPLSRVWFTGNCRLQSEQLGASLSYSLILPDNF